MKIAVFLCISGLALLALGGLWYSQPAKAQASKRASVPEQTEPIAPPPMPLFERTSAATPAEPVVPEPLAEKVAAPPAVNIEEERLEFENRFDSERGRSALRRLEAVVASTAARIAVPGSQLEKIECRESICKMSLKFDNREVDSDFFHKLTHPDERTEDSDYLGSFDIVIPERTETAGGAVHAQAYLKRPTFTQ